MVVSSKVGVGAVSKEPQIAAPPKQLQFLYFFFTKKTPHTKHLVELLQEPLQKTCQTEPEQRRPA